MIHTILHPITVSLPPDRRSGRRQGRRRSGHRRGFTLIEILTVIGILVILVGMLLVAIKYARNSAARSRTQAQLATLRGMLAELDAANKLSQSPPVWLWYDNTTPTPPYVINSGDFWRYPFGIPANTTSSPNYPAYWDSLDNPGDVADDGTAQAVVQRNASFAVLNTQLAMQMLAAIPANRAALDKLPADSKMLPTWTSSFPLQATPYPFPTGTPDFVGLLKDDGTDGLASAGPDYLQGMHVSYQGHYYVCTPPAGSTPPTTATPGNPGWYDETAAPRGAPILLDGWNNPIIFVPASGLHVKSLNGQGKYLPADPATGLTQEVIVVSPEGHVTGNGTANPYVDRPGRPFFVSAGPSGDFTRGDEILCSFNY